MISSLIDSLLPGTRSLRPPLISGLLWALLILVLYTESVSESTDMAGQAFILISEINTLPVIVVISVLIWVLGVLSMAFTEFLSKAIAPVLSKINRWFVWKIHAYKKAKDLEQKLDKLQNDYETKSNDGKQSSGRNLEIINKKITELIDKIDQVKSSTTCGLWISENPSTSNILGKPTQHDRTFSICYNIVDGVMREAMHDEMQSFSDKKPTSSINMATLGYEEMFLEEFEPDPLDALRGMDESLFLELDRERTENEVRLGISTPLLVLGIIGSLTWGYLFLIFSLFGTLLLSKGALDQSIERSRVINLVGLKGLQTPALRLAAIEGRNQLHRFLAEKQQESNQPDSK